MGLHIWPTAQANNIGVLLQMPAQISNLVVLALTDHALNQLVAMRFAEIQIHSLGLLVLANVGRSF